jgi:hypothetical protein
MSTSSSPLWPPADASPSRIVQQLLRSLRTAVTHVRPLLQATAFWSAVAMPFLYVPLLLGGLTGAEFSTFFALVLVNGAVLVLGHGHNAEEPEPDPDPAGQ